MRRPAVVAAIAFAFGIAVASIVPPHAPVWLAATIALLVALLIVRRWWVVADLCCLAALMCAGVLAGQLHESYFATDHIAGLVSDEPRLAHLRVRIDDPPRLTSPHRFASRQSAHATVLEAKTTRGWQPASGKIVVKLSTPVEGLAVGQTVEIFGWLHRPERATNPGQFDWAGYYRADRIVAAVDVTEPSCVQILDRGHTGLLWPARQFTRDLLRRGFTEEQGVDHALLQALLLGDSDPQLRDVQDLFVATGTSHHLAISGMHIVVLAGLVYLACRVARLRPRHSAVIGLVSVLLYGFMTVPSPPVVRSVILSVTMLAGLVFRRSVDVLQLLAVSVLAMLVVNPADLASPGFQLSFGTVLGLILFQPAANRWLTSWFEDEHDRVAASFQRPPRLVRWRRNIRGKMVEVVAAGVVAWAVSLPLILHHFDRMNPWAILSSILLSPVVFAGLLGGVFKVVLTLACPWLAGAWAAIAAWPMIGMRWSVEHLARLPWSDVPFPAPGPVLIAAFYGLLLIWPKWRPDGPLAVWSRRVAPFGALAALTVSWPIAAIRASNSPPPLRITVLDAGQGSCTVIETPDGQVSLVDAGSRAAKSFHRNILAPYLRLRHASRVGDVLVTTPSADHFNAVEDLIASHGARAVYVPATFEADRTGYAASRFLRHLRNSNRAPYRLAAGDILHLGKGVDAEVLWPPADGKLATNGDALVVQIRYAGRSILLTGDLSDAAQRHLINSGTPLKSDVLLAPSHGTATAMTPFLLHAVSASTVLASDGGEPTPKQLAFDRAAGKTPVYRTGRHGAVTVAIDAQGKLSLTPFLRK